MGRIFSAGCIQTMFSKISGNLSKKKKKDLGKNRRNSQGRGAELGGTVVNNGRHENTVCVCVCVCAHTHVRKKKKRGRETHTRGRGRGKLGRYRKKLKG